jgi:putative membrane protein
MISFVKLLLHIALSAAALLFVAQYIEGIDITGWQAALVVVFALFIIKYTIKPILTIVTLPINLLTLGLFTFVINGILFWLVAKYVEGFEVTTLVAGIIGAFVVSVIKTIGGYFIDLLK